MFDKKIQHDGFVHFVEYTMVKVSQQSNMYRTVDMKIRVISTLFNLKFFVQSTLVWWDSNFIPRFTKIFEYWKNFSVIVFGIKISAFPRNLSPWARSRAEKSHQTFRSLRLGEVPLKISFLKNAWCHRNQR